MPDRLALRLFTPHESRTLKAKVRDLSLSARIHQRYRIVEQVHRGHSLSETADRVGCHFTVAYDWVHRFNESGFSTFEQVANPKGRPPILRAEQLRELNRSGLVQPAGARIAVLQLVGPEVGRVLPSHALASAGH